MNNVLAIAHKELKGYFASPVAYVVIGFSAILFGWFFINLLYYFDRTQMQAGSGFQGPQAINVNEIMISPLFLNVSVILLFTLPLITMRTYAEEKRSGTIELLLTSPLTDLQIVMGKCCTARCWRSRWYTWRSCSSMATPSGGRLPPDISA
jgi:ABC-2 type transport system permease protein